MLRIAYIGKQGLSTFEDLGLDGQTLSRLRHSLRHPAGAIIVAGPTGSGKTTTLYAALGELNDGSRTIVSIEDPVESRIDGVVQVEVNTRAGLTFARGLRTHPPGRPRRDHDRRDPRPRDSRDRPSRRDDRTRRAHDRARSERRRRARPPPRLRHCRGQPGHVGTHRPLSAAAPAPVPALPSRGSA